MKEVNPSGRSQRVRSVETTARQSFRKEEALRVFRKNNQINFWRGPGEGLWWPPPTPRRSSKARPQGPKAQPSPGGSLFPLPPSSRSEAEGTLKAGFHRSRPGYWAASLDNPGQSHSEMSRICPAAVRPLSELETAALPELSRATQAGSCVLLLCWRLSEDCS